MAPEVTALGGSRASDRRPPDVHGFTACYAKHVGPARYGALTTPDPDEEVRSDAEI
jgi:hypothetical protein